MKILIVTPYFYPSLGGAQSYAFQIAQGLKAAHGHKVVIVTSGEKGGTISRQKVKGITVYRLPYHFKLSNTPISFSWKRQLKEIIARESPDVVNAHSPVPYMADVAASVCKKLHLPFVLTYHSGSMKKNKLLPDILISTYEIIFLRKLIKRSQRIITYNDFLSRKYSASEKITYAYPGVNTDIFQPMETQKDTTPNDKTILFVGRIDKTSEWKGLKVLLKAMPYILASDPSITLRLVGGGDAVDVYKGLTKKLNIQNNVKFVGTKFNKNLANEYRNATVLVLPSTTESESFGMVLIESLACGTPVIASNVGGMPQVINSTGGGLLVEANNEANLAEAIITITKDKNLQNRLAKKGYENVRILYRWQLTVEAVNKVLSKAVSRDSQIVHVVATYPPQLGGMESVVQTLARLQSKEGQKTLVITSDQGLNRAVKPPADNFEIKRLRSFEVAHTPIIPGLLFKLLGLGSNDIVHLHVAQAYTPESVFLASKIKGFRYIAHVHLDVAPSGPAGFLLKLYQPLILKFVLRAAHSVVVFTEDQKMGVHIKYGVDLSKIRVIPNGVEDKFYYDKTRVLQKKPKLLFVGRLSVQKNLTQLLQALEGVSSQFEVSIVGDGELRTELKSLAKSLKLENVTFRGRADGDVLLNFYKRADIFVLPSEREGMPLVLLEAMAMGLPVIATDVAGNREVVKKGMNGLLVPLGDFKALRKALLGVASSTEEYSKMSYSSKQMAKGYSWDKVRRKLKPLYYEASR